MKIGFIGCSGHLDGGIDYLRQNPSARLAGFAPGCPEENMERMAGIAEELGGIMYSDYRLLLQDRPDVVVVNSHFHRNAALSEEVMERGIHCFCDKPAGLTLAAVDRVENAWRRSGVQYACIMEMRGFPPFAAAKRAVDAGAIGTPVLVTGQKSYKMGRRDPFYHKIDYYGGTIAWIGIHLFDLAAWMTGLGMEPLWAFSTPMCNGGTGEMEAAAAAGFRLENGGTAVFSMDYLRPSSAPSHGDDRIRIAGSAGVLEVMGEQAVLLSRDGRQVLPSPPVEDVFTTFIKAVSGEGACAVSAEESFRISRLAVRAQKLANHNT